MMWSTRRMSRLSEPSGARWPLPYIVFGSFEEGSYALSLLLAPRGLHTPNFYFKKAGPIRDCRAAEAWTCRRCTHTRTRRN